MTTFKKRMMRIAKADRLCSQANDYAVGADSDSKEGIRRYRKAARLFSYAADTYRLADMGLLAKSCYRQAAECWFCVGEEEFCKQNEIREAAIPVYWGGEGQ